MLQGRSRTTHKIAPMDKAALLLVDDDQLITESLSIILKKKYRIYIAETRAQAKDIISSLQSPPQLALVDLGLPPFPHRADEGFALIEDLLAQDPQMKILVLSGQSEEMNIQHALTLGAADLFHRLSVLKIQLPPLREREKDSLKLILNRKTLKH
jgi:DNA-binding NtrC family response regulator